MLEVITTVNIQTMDVTDVIMNPDGYVDHAMALCFVRPKDITVPVATIKSIAVIGLYMDNDCFLSEYPNNMNIEPYSD